MWFPTQASQAISPARVVVTFEPSYGLFPEYLLHILTSYAYKDRLALEGDVLVTLSVHFFFG
jgi:hypothetical protein